MFLLSAVGSCTALILSFLGMWLTQMSGTFPYAFRLSLRPKTTLAVGSLGISLGIQNCLQS